MEAPEQLLILGASARAAALSALRAGLRPWCIDLFADEDLRHACSAATIPLTDYPRGFLNAVRDAPPGPWMYTGGLENHPALLDALARLRPLWGNGAAVVRRVRAPGRVAAALREAGLPCPEVRRGDDPAPGRWLVKPRAGAGGRGIVFLAPDTPPRRRVYLQQHVEGAPCSAVYVGRDGGAQLLGATRQLVGEPWLHAAPFQYCGSVGPLTLSDALRVGLERLGDLLGRDFGLRGLFGVDFILSDGVPWPVEVNPRYTASVEVLEYAIGIPALALHRAVFTPAAPLPPPTQTARPARLGKAILFAAGPLTFPVHGPWARVLREPPALPTAPAFADIPAAGTRIETGWPVLTCFAAGATDAECVDRLRAVAADLDRRLPCR